MPNLIIRETPKGQSTLDNTQTHATIITRHRTRRKKIPFSKRNSIAHHEVLTITF